jgi:hypothetical protein
MPHRHHLLVPLLCLSLALAACGRPRGGGGPGDDDDDAAGSTGPLVKGLAIDGIALYQGVRIDLVRGGDVTIEDAPVDVVSDRDAMLRVLVNAGSDWQSRTVAAVVTLDLDGDGDRETFVGEQNISASTDDRSLNNSIQVDIPGEFMTRSAGLVSVRLVETEDGVEASGNDSGASWTAPGDFLDLNARDTGPSVRIVLVPIEYRGDGSGRLPDLSDSQLQIYRDHLYAQYPTREVDLVVGDPMVVNYQISPFGQGWSQTLEALYYRRDDENASFEEYYYGLFSPASSFNQFCQQGCVAGLSSLAQSANDSWARVSMGLGFSGAGSADTMVHEIGHAHGREHAPCGTQDSGYYPHSGADIGVQGYDVVTGTLKNTGSLTDFMGYCDPTWVSDYSYNWLFDRITEVNSNAELIPPPGFSPDWTAVRIEPDGRAFRGARQRLLLPPQGTKQEVVFLDAGGEELSRVQGAFFGYSHLGGGRLLLPTPGDKVAAVRLSSGVTVPW